MGKNANFVSHKKSKLKNQDGSPQLPSASALVEGEIAINFGKDVETLSIKNESGDVVTFSSDNYYSEQKLGSAFTGANSAVTVTDVIEENEEIIAAALTDLDERKLDASAYTPSVELWVSGTGLNSVVLKGSSGTASGDYSVAEGYSYEYDGETYTSIASGSYSHTEGSGTLASGNWGSHAEGDSTSATSDSSHAEGFETLASGDYSHAEGNSTSATSDSSHAEGKETLASGGHSHAEGYETSATGYSSHAEGSETLASGDYSHAEGDGTVASGDSSHAEGSSTIASGDFSHAEGLETIATNNSEHASGRYNVSNSGSTEFGHSGNTLFSVGNGTNRSERHNAFEIRQNGDIYITSGSSDIKLQDYLGGGSGIVDQVLDDTTSASTNAVSSKAVYKTVTDNELVWTNAYVTLSGTVSAHTANTEIHVTAADKEKLHTHSNKSALDSITGNVGTMAYEDKASYSSATEVNTALGNKANTSDLASYADSVKYDSTSHYVEFYHGTTAGTKVFEFDASPFIIDGMVQNVEIKDVTSGGSQVTCLVISFNTDAGKQDINVPISDIFDANNYYQKSETSSKTEIEEAILWEAGSGANSVVLKNSSGTATGDYSVAEGNSTSAMSPYSHAEGYKTFVSGPGSEHAEGYYTNAINHSHAEGDYTSAITNSHTEGYGTFAVNNSHAEGYFTKAINYYSHAEGQGTSATSQASHAEGISTLASGDFSHAEGQGTEASGHRSHAEGLETVASGNSSHAEGQSTSATSNSSHAEGYETLASGDFSHAEGDSTSATSNSSHAEGGNTIASGEQSHAEGGNAIASGNYSHAEGDSTSATSNSSHAEGQLTLASGINSHAEGEDTKAEEYVSHAEGYSTSATSMYSHAEGLETIATNNSEHASGQYNVSNSATTTFGNSGNTLFSVGNGYYDENQDTVVRHNAFEIRQNGDIYIVSGNSDIKLQDYIGGSVETVTAITPSNSGSTNPVSTKVVAENELTVSNALNDLDARKLDASAYTPTDLSNYYTKSETSGATELTTAFAAKANTATTLAGYGITNAYTKSETSGATELTNALNNKADSAITFTAGTGLSGGGDLSSNRTFNLAMPTTYSAETYTSSTITSSEPIVYALVSYSGTAALNNQVCPVSSLADGQQCNVIYHSANNNAYDAVISTNYVEPDGQAITLKIPAGGYAEINYINIKGMIFVRGI